jgi:hypothetical protein
MLGEGGTPLAELVDAVNKFLAREDRPVDLTALREGIDLLKYELFHQEWSSRNHLPRSGYPLERDRS